MTRWVRRRALVFGAAAAAATGAAGVALGVQTGMLPGKRRIAGWFGANGPHVDPQAASAAPIERGRFASAALGGQEVNFAIARPPGTWPERLPVAVLLHGSTDTCMTPFDSVQLHQYLAEAVDAGTTPFAIATLDGGESFWINRDSGRWADMVADFLSVLAEHELDTSRVALTGYSMGGYGAVMLAARQLKGRVRAVFAASACMWARFDQTEPGAFDSAEHFAANNPWQPSVVDGLGDLPLALACGTNDPFVDGNRAWVAAKGPTAAGLFSRGDHSQNYWRSVAPQQLRFIGAHI